VWCVLYVVERKGEKVRDPSNPPKSGRILCWFPHLVDI
jgi:hypothetical protein